ncbi:major facilitator superfamily transporter [Xylariaceae sp. FL0594]|nr:major facilitator superfamily transporter [Xylariaceae sp. FL0594]
MHFSDNSKNMTEASDDRSANNPTLGSSASSLQDEHPHHFHHRHHREEYPTIRLILLGVGLLVGLFLSFLDTAIVATSLFSIGTDLGDMERVNWVALAYTLSYLGCAVLLARISDVIGRRDAFLLSYVIFIAFSLGCGFAQTLDQLIAFRALQGVGGSGLYSITMIALPEVVPAKVLQALAAVIGLVITLASVLGPVLGGVLTQYASWRWVFWINGPIGGVAALLFFLMWPKPRYLPNLERRTWGELDYVGSSLLIASTVLIVFPFQSVGSSTDQWDKAIFLAPLIVGCVALVVLFAWSIFVDKRWGDKIAAALPMNLLRNRVYASAVLNTMFLGFPYTLIVYAFPLRCQVVNAKDALIAGVMLLPMLGSSAVGSAISGKANGKKDHSCETLLVATGFMTLGGGLLTTVSDSVDLQAKALGFLVFIGLGFGLSVSTTTMLAASQSSMRDHAAAQGIVAQVRVFGGSLGIAASSAILGVTLQQVVGKSVTPQQLSSLGGGHADLTPGQLASIRKAYSDAFRKDMQVCTIIAGVALLWAIGTYNRKRLTRAGKEGQRASEKLENLGTAVGTADEGREQRSDQQSV